MGAVAPIKSSPAAAGLHNDGETSVNAATNKLDMRTMDQLRF
jgi:hypothetical protein